jgi:hypothetical protein
MNTRSLSCAHWRKSSYSNGQASCVEVAIIDEAVAIRDTKDRTGPVLVFSRQQWQAFTSSVRVASPAPIRLDPVPGQ